MTFHNLQVHPRFLPILEKQKITTPSPVQAEAIPPALAGRDVIAIAQTGTGKTLAFGLPALTRLEKAPRGRTAMLVLAPTRELAQQVHNVLAEYARPLRLTTACIYGGVGMAPQTQALRRGATIVVATPGRLLDHMRCGNTRFDGISCLVLDEADRMLDMGFMPDIRRILAEIPRDRQTMMFSATFPDEIARLAADMQVDPVRIEIGAVARPSDTVRQSLYAVASDDKLALLANILSHEDVTSTVVFVRTKRRADRVAKSLIRQDFRAEAIHGDHAQGRRQRTIEGFRRGRHTILVATDVAARGLDVKGITHVINYDLPMTPDDYIHRIGRTARAHADGDAITFVSPGEEMDLHQIERKLEQPIDRIAWHGEAHLANVQERRPPARQARGGGPRNGKKFVPHGKRRGSAQGASAGPRAGGKPFRPRRANNSGGAQRPSA